MVFEMVVKARVRKKHLEKERKHLFSKRAKELDFRSGWPKFKSCRITQVTKFT